MRACTLVALMSTLLAMMALACGGSTTAPPDAMVGEDAGGQYDAEKPQSDGPPVDASPTIGIGMTYTVWVSGEPVEGIECCLDGTTNCDTTNASGMVMLSRVPANSEVGITCSKSGYMTRHRQLTTALANIGTSDAYFPDALLESWAQAAGTTLDPTKAFIFVQGNWVDLSRAGVEFSLTPSSGVGPIYFDDVGAPDPALTCTSNQSYAFYVNVAPGDYVFSATSTNGCRFFPPYGWEGETSDTLAVQAQAGTFAGAFLMCQ
jgi:hypothetical protein